MIRQNVNRDQSGSIVFFSFFDFQNFRLENIFFFDFDRFSSSNAREQSSRESRALIGRAPKRAHDEKYSDHTPPSSLEFYGF